MEFNEQQQKIIDNVLGAYLISAPVGTGKTTVLAERVVKALEEGIRPEEILCLTFTNRAVEEMGGRIKKRINKKEIYNEIAIKTFHGFCAFLVRQESKRLGINSDFAIIDDEEQVEIMEEILENHPGIIPDNTYSRAGEIRKLLEKIYNLRLEKFEQEIGWKKEISEQNPALLQIHEDYAKALADQNGLDFNELVMLTLKGLYQDEDLKNKWSKKYKFIQLDEFQDTHVSEYLVVKQLAREHKNIALIGDLDQTIYGWRGSEPNFIAGQFKKHFAPVMEYQLEINYRFDNNLLESVKSFLVNLGSRHTKNLVSNNAKVEGGSKSIAVFSGHNFEEEISWVTDTIKEIRKNEPSSKIAVLARANYMIQEASKVFEKKNIAFITVDKYDFFRRQEVKDIFACLKIIFNRFDLDSAYRLVQRPSRNIGTTTLQSIREVGDRIGIRVSDFLTLKNYTYLEPFDNLITAGYKGRIVVLDTETTGTNPLKDEIIQIYAREMVNGKREKEFHFYLKNTIPVGGSYDIHGITDEFLAAKGNDPKKVLNELKDFIGKSIVSGHNVNFDLAMIVENGKRNGIDFEFKEYYDTLDLSRRLIKSENYKLNTLSKLLGLETATHSAEDDVAATMSLLEILITKLKLHTKDRQTLFSRYSKKFIQLSIQINNWNKVIREKRPSVALSAIFEDSGLKEYYEKDKDSVRRFKSIEALLDFFEKSDDPDRASDEVLRSLIQYSALTKNIDFLGLEKGKIPVVTVHQVKGLEFDHVFIVGLNEFKFPSYRSDPEEEMRLFYVALTRARKNIYISYSANDTQGRPMAKSRFVDYIDPKFVDFIR